MANHAKSQSIRHQIKFVALFHQSQQTHDAIAEIVGKQALYTTRRI
jgi:hypothetical protein